MAIATSRLTCGGRGVMFVKIVFFPMMAMRAVPLSSMNALLTSRTYIADKVATATVLNVNLW